MTCKPCTSSNPTECCDFIEKAAIFAQIKLNIECFWDQDLDIRRLWYYIRLYLPNVCGSFYEGRENEKKWTTFLCDTDIMNAEYYFAAVEAPDKLLSINSNIEDFRRCLGFVEKTRAQFREVQHEKIMKFVDMF